MNQQLRIVPSGKRKVIGIKDLKAYVRKYQMTGLIESDNLIKPTQNKIRSIALFCNEYIPEHFPKDKKYVQYFLVINGQDYEIEPINSPRNGKKIIKKQIGAIEDEETIYIDNYINSAYLRILLTAPNEKESPFIANLKILYSEEKDYV